MKRFLAFEYDAYYPVGARTDFTADFDTLEDAVAFRRSDFGLSDYLDVLDTRTGKWSEYTPCGDQKEWRLCYPDETPRP